MNSHISRLSLIGNETNLSEKAAASLRQAIKDGDLPPGTHLIEQKIAEQLGISRMPVREAVQQLISEGLVIKEPRRGAYVHPFAPQELEEVYSIRVLLERFIVERDMAHWTPALSEQLRLVVEAMIVAARLGDKDAVLKLDAQFHETLWKTADHAVLLEVVSGLRSRISRFLYEATKALKPEALNEHARLHADLLEILKSGDVAVAQNAISDHIMAAKERIRNFYLYLEE
ncbi:MAG: GntR family transcriptional regulator [Aggregatilineales bacterium]